MRYPLAPRDRWYGDANYKMTGGRLVWMTPDSFLRRVRQLKLDETAEENISDLKTHVLQGGELDPLSISATGREDGRHRAVMARRLQIRQVPVLVWPKAAAQRDKDYRGTPSTVDWSRLAYMVRRRRPGALEVLQDAIETYFPKQFKRAQANAKLQMRRYVTRFRVDLKDLDWYVQFQPRIARLRFKVKKKVRPLRWKIFPRPARLRHSRQTPFYETEGPWFAPSNLTVWSVKKGKKIQDLLRFQS